MSHQEVEKFIGLTMESDFREIKKAANLLQQLVEQSRGEHDDSLVKDIGMLGDFLTSRSLNHFRLEERIGACSFMAQERPRLEGNLRKVQADYRPLADLLEELKTCVDEISLAHSKTFDLLEAKLTTFCSMLEAHAEKENLFVLDAFYQETGQSD